MTKPPRRVTIHDVAEACGLALSTVSNALAGKPHVSESTRERVREAAGHLGYRASSLARALRMQRSFTIGVLMADVGNPSFPAFVRGVEDVAIRKQCDLLLCNTDGLEEKQIRAMRALLDRQVDGMVLISQHTASPSIRALLDQGVPFVLIQRRTPAFQDDFVGSDNRAGIAAAARHLLELGHRRIGFVRGPRESSTAAERFAAYRAAIRRHGFDADPALIHQGDYGVETGRQAGRALLSLSCRPTAIMASNDLNALGVLDAAFELGMAVPDEVSVVGFDDIALSALRRIDLTTIRQPKREMGSAAAELLMRRISAKRPGPPREIIFPIELVVRSSTGPAAQMQADGALVHGPNRRREIADRVNRA